MSTDVGTYYVRYVDGQFTDLGVYDVKYNHIKKYKVEYNSNNSGGYWWLDDQDWYNLQEAGWDVDWYKDKESQFSSYKGGRFLGALAGSASVVVDANSESDAENIAIAQFEDITGQDVDDPGCSCCGSPHSFYVDEVEG